MEVFYLFLNEIILLCLFCRVLVDVRFVCISVDDVVIRMRKYF